MENKGILGLKKLVEIFEINICKRGVLSRGVFYLRFFGWGGVRVSGRSWVRTFLDRWTKVVCCRVWKFGLEF